MKLAIGELYQHCLVENCRDMSLVYTEKRADGADAAKSFSSPPSSFRGGRHGGHFVGEILSNLD